MGKFNSYFKVIDILKFQNITLGIHRFLLHHLESPIKKAV